MWKLIDDFLAFLRRKPVAKILSADEAGVTTRSDKSGPITIPWNDIDEIETLKLDLFNYDEVRLLFRVGDGRLELSEEDPGFVEVMSAMQDRFPSIPNDWYFTVRENAFVANQKTLWRRGD